MKLDKILLIGVLASLFTFIISCFFSVREIFIGYVITIVLICLISISFFICEIRNELQITRRIVIHEGLSDKDAHEFLKLMLKKLTEKDRNDTA